MLIVVITIFMNLCTSKFLILVGVYEHVATEAPEDIGTEAIETIEETTEIEITENTEADDNTIP